jgi:hypothetical protein
MEANQVLEQDVLECDVCILGAGAAGCYAAIRLRDRGISSIVLEKSARVGGHTETYREPGKGNHFDIGVRIYPDIPIVRQYCARLGVKLVKADIKASVRTIYVDVKSGKPVPSRDPHPLLTWFALWRLERIVKRKFGYLEKPGFQLPEAVPEDLLLPLWDFLSKHRIGRSYIPFMRMLQGFGAPRALPALYALKNLSATVMRCARFLSFVTVDQGCETLYDKISGALGNTLRCNVQIQSIRRSGALIEVTATQGGRSLAIRCRKLFVTYPPLLSRMDAIDLDQQEKSVFSKLKHYYYWTVVATISGLPTGADIVPIKGDNPLAEYVLPGIYMVLHTPIPDRYNILYGSEYPLTQEEVLDDIGGFIRQVSKNIDGNDVKLEAVQLFKDHAPYGTRVTPDDVRKGFYRSLSALQGHNNTYYLGAAVDTNASHSVWLHAEEILSTVFDSRRN